MVTEYVSNGNLEDILHNRKVAMPLDRRLGIAIWCAQALCYMHSLHLSTDSLVCHGDIKPANILSDDNLTAKISDFGLSRLLSGGTTRHTVNVKGSIDYMDPIYLQNGCLTPRNDVYSFGIVLLELITRKRVKEGNISLIDTFGEAFVKGKVLLRELFDDELVNEGNLEVLETIGKLANKCLNLNIKIRPKMNVVAEQLLKLWAGLRGGQSLLKMSLRIFKRNTVNPEIRTKLHNVKVFTTGELTRVTQNYSCLIDKSLMHEVHKGTLEDNTLVAVVTCLFDHKLHPTDEFIRTVKLMSQIVHKNIIKLLGYCFEHNSRVLVFEYACASTRRLTDILHGNKDHLSLELRLKIAVQTAQALVYIQPPSTHVSHHGWVMTSNILIDDNFIPKVTGHTSILQWINISKDYSKPSARNETHYKDPKSVKNDVYSFGVVLMELISRKRPIYGKSGRLIINFRRAYMTDGSGKEMFDNEISAEDDIAVLEQIGKLECTWNKQIPPPFQNIRDFWYVYGQFQVYPRNPLCVGTEAVDERPTVEQVAKHLEMLRRYWKKRRATSCTAAAVSIG